MLFLSFLVTEFDVEHLLLFLYLFRSNVQVTSIVVDVPSRMPSLGGPLRSFLVLFDMNIARSYDCVHVMRGAV